MSNDGAPKSAYELAMDRLKKKDEEAGIAHKPVTDEQKAAIAEIRTFYQAKIAELELLHQGKVMPILDPAERAQLDQDYHRDRERLTAERERKIERARNS